jgi:hypothetical protein
MNKEIQSIKKRLSTQLEHKYRYLGYCSNATDDEKERYQKEIKKANMIIESLRKEFIIAVGRSSVMMSAEAVKQQWEMIVKEVERKL